MKVFISWSGETSHRVAIVLRDWLPSVIQSLQPYLSSEDIDKGARWSTDISKELEDSSFGVLCITKDNLDAPWLNFEAGALSKYVDKSRVSPFLFGIKRSEIHQGPLLQFQSTTFKKDDVRKLVQSLNAADDTPTLDEARLDVSFDVWWPELKKRLSKISTPIPDDKDVTRSSEKVGPSSDILEEVLELLRAQQRLLNSPSELLPPNYLESVLHRSEIMFDHPAIRSLEEFWHEFNEILSSFDEEEPVPLSIIHHLRSRLKRPMRHILHRRRRLPWGAGPDLFGHRRPDRSSGSRSTPAVAIPPPVRSAG